MKKYTIAFIIIVMMSIVFQPRPAQAAITIDFAAIAGTIQEVVQSIKDKVSKLKITVIVRGKNVLNDATLEEVEDNETPILSDSEVDYMV